MNVNERSAILLIKSAITGQKVTLPEGANLQKIGSIFMKQAMVSVFRAGLENSQIDVPKNLQDFLKDYYCVEFLTSEQQLTEIAALEAAFAENGIEYMPLKGTIMKAKYPDHAMRYMSDADILIHQEDKEKLDSIMIQLGYTQLTESDHELNWTKPQLKVELHKRLVATHEKDYYEYLGEGWQFAKNKNGYRCAMTEEDAFIFEVMHFTKHYCRIDSSVRHIVDLWMHLRCAPNMDQTYIHQQMKKMQLDVFYDHILELIAAWFEDGQWSAVTEHISDFVFGNGVPENHFEIADTARATYRAKDTKVSKTRSLLLKLFPEKKNLHFAYPQLQKWPLFIGWMVRWFILVTKRQNTVKENYEKMQNVTQEEVDTHMNNLDYVGLHFPV